MDKLHFFFNFCLGQPIVKHRPNLVNTFRHKSSSQKIMIEITTYLADLMKKFQYFLIK